MAGREYSEAEVVAKIAARRDEIGGVRALAREIGVTPSYVSDVLNHRRAPGPAFLDAVGVRKYVVVGYVDKGAAKP